MNRLHPYPKIVNLDQTLATLRAQEAELIELRAFRERVREERPLLAELTLALHEVDRVREILLSVRDSIRRAAA